MSKAYLTPPRGIKLPNGGKMQHGMIIGGSDTMQQPRKLNSSDDGGPDVLVHSRDFGGQPLIRRHSRNRSDLTTQIGENDHG
jgi:hypothetical protein